ncbi:MAG: hypothetical protein ACREBB_06665 [Nitrosotalea sp.]
MNDYFDNFNASWFIIKKVLISNGFKQKGSNPPRGESVYFIKEGRKQPVLVPKENTLFKTALVDIANQAGIREEIFLAQISVFKVKKYKK